MYAVHTLSPTHAGDMTNRELLHSLGINVPAGAAGVISHDDVRDLIDAAGPLTACDIAGGLLSPLRAVAALVRQMTRVGALRRDEFGRYGLRPEE